MSKTATLPQGKVQYLDRGEGEPIVFVHGFLVDSRLWRGVADALEGDFRCITPDWPMGSQRIALEPGADLSPPGVAELIVAFLDELGIERATIVGNDSGGAMSQILTANHPERVERLALTNCDTLEHFPPSVFKALPPLVKLPGGMTLTTLPFRIGPIARFAYKPFAANPIPAELVSSWLEPSLTDSGVRRDTRKLTMGMHKRHTLAAAEKLRSLDVPVRLIWGTEDAFFKLDQAERFASMLRDVELVEIPGAKTFSPLDRPQAVADAIAGFVRAETRSVPAEAG
jgi:pimeloyl-ACP methyl ester carboxylesterase